MFGFGKKKEKPADAPSAPNAAEAAGSPGVAASTPDEVRAALKQVVESQSRETEMAFWQQMMRLPQWHFAVDQKQAREAIETGGAPPILTYVQGENLRMAAVYSTPELASQASQGGDGSAVISMATGDAIGFVCSKFETVAGIMVDFVPDGAQGFGTDLWALPGLFNHFNTLPPIAALDALSRSISNSGHPMEYKLAYRMIAAVPNMLVAMQGEQPAVMPVGEELSIIGFTDQQRASRFASQIDGISILEATPAQFAQLLAAVVKGSEGKVTGAIVNPGPTGIGVNSEMLAEAIASETA